MHSKQLLLLITETAFLHRNEQKDKRNAESRSASHVHSCLFQVLSQTNAEKAASFDLSNLTCV